MGEKPEQNLQIFINDQSVTFDAAKIDSKRYITIDKDSSKKVFLSKSPVFRGADNFYDEPVFTKQKSIRDLGFPNQEYSNDTKKEKEANQNKLQ